MTLLITGLYPLLIAFALSLLICRSLIFVKTAIILSGMLYSKRDKACNLAPGSWYTIAPNPEPYDSLARGGFARLSSSEYSDSDQHSSHSEESSLSLSETYA
jgi:hypothetical protein